MDPFYKSKDTRTVGNANQIIAENEASEQSPPAISNTWAQEKITATEQEIANLPDYEASTTWVNKIIVYLILDIFDKETNLELNAASDANTTLFRLFDVVVQRRRQKQKAAFSTWSRDDLIDIITGVNKDWDELLQVWDRSVFTGPSSVYNEYDLLFQRNFNLGSCRMEMEK